MATAPIGPLAWEPLYATGAAQENGKKTKKKKIMYYRIQIGYGKSELKWKPTKHTKLITIKIFEINKILQSNLE